MTEQVSEQPDDPATRAAKRWMFNPISIRWHYELASIIREEYAPLVAEVGQLRTRVGEFESEQCGHTLRRDPDSSELNCKYEHGHKGPHENFHGVQWSAWRFGRPNDIAKVLCVDWRHSNLHQQLTAALADVAKAKEDVALCEELHDQDLKSDEHLREMLRRAESTIDTLRGANARLEREVARLKDERDIENLAEKIQRSMCGYEGEAGRIREREILSLLRKHFGQDGELQSRASQEGNPSSSALAVEDEPERRHRAVDAREISTDGPQREPVTADTEGQPRADEASRPTSMLRGINETADRKLRREREDARTFQPPNQEQGERRCFKRACNRIIGYSYTRQSCCDPCACVSVDAIGHSAHTRLCADANPSAPPAAQPSEPGCETCSYPAVESEWSDEDAVAHFSEIRVYCPNESHPETPVLDDIGADWIHNHFNQLVRILKRGLKGGDVQCVTDSPDSLTSNDAGLDIPPSSPQTTEPPECPCCPDGCRGLHEDVRNFGSSEVPCMRVVCAVHPFCLREYRDRALKKIKEARVNAFADGQADGFKMAEAKFRVDVARAAERSAKRIASRTYEWIRPHAHRIILTEFEWPRTEPKSDAATSPLLPPGNWHAIEGANGRCACGPDAGCGERLQRYVSIACDDQLDRQRWEVLDEMPDAWRRHPGSLAQKVGAMVSFFAATPRFVVTSEMREKMAAQIEGRDGCEWVCGIPDENGKIAHVENDKPCRLVKYDRQVICDTHKCVRVSCRSHCDFTAPKHIAQIAAILGATVSASTTKPCDIPLGEPSALHSELSEAGELDEHVRQRHPECSAENGAEGR